MKLNVGNKMDAKHVFIFQTRAGEMTVGTDDLVELSNQKWFTDFLGTPEKLKTTEKVTPVAKYTDDELKRFSDIAYNRGRAESIAESAEIREDEVRQRAMDLIREREKESVPSVDDLPPPLPPAEEVSEVAKDLGKEMAQKQEEMDRQPTKPVQAQQVQTGRPNIRSDVPGIGQVNFMDINPDKMTGDLWSGLTEEQRTEYGQKYMK